jgi:formylglycine-generating enzyme required for sulfatase activity
MCASTAHAVTFDWSTIGNPGNAGDALAEGTFGAVDYVYRISKYEVTNDQYAEFLNSVAASDPNSLFNVSMDITQSGIAGTFTYSVNSGYGSHPVRFVSFFDAMRFVNWLENGQPVGTQGPGTTEAGVYTIGTGVDETRALGATFVIPSQDEWYKAAYHDPRLEAEGGPPGDDHYWSYPTQSDMDPIAEAPPGGTNSANYDLAVFDTTDVGAYIDTTSFYGTFDQAGNVCEWNETLYDLSQRGVGGGCWACGIGCLVSSHNASTPPTIENELLGIRVASVPEPKALVLAALAALAFLADRRRFSKVQ